MEGQMTDDQVEKLIWNQIKRKKITFGDMIALSNNGVDPKPEAGYEDRTKRLRRNIFTQNCDSERMKELLCVGKYSEWDEYVRLKISLQGLFRFWWNRCVQQEEVADEILENIFDYFTEKMRPPQEEKEGETDLTLDFDQLPLFVDTAEEAA
jgi:hypothetical protein